jgi:hypothetical protein
MIEFSESYHLRARFQADAADLLSRAGVAGYVFPEQDGWVSFVADGTPFVPNDALIEANQGLLLHWLYSEDAWEFHLWQGAQLIHEYACTWDDGIIHFNRGPSHVQLKRALGLELPGLKGTAGQQMMQPESLKEIYNLKPAHAFAHALGLTHYAHLSFDDLHLKDAAGEALPAGVKTIA